MFGRFKPKSEFARNVLILMTGTTIAQAIPIAISPILTRIYTPEDFGVFALYMSMASIVSVMATGRYELAIMLPKKDEDAINIVALSIMISFLVSFITLLIVFFFNTPLTTFLGNPEISDWLYFIPLTVLLTGFYQSFNYWSNRKKEYKRLATSRVIQSGTTVSSNLALGFAGLGSGGLIWSSIFGKGIASFMLGKMIVQEDKSYFGDIKQLKVFALMRRYIKFPKFDVPSALIYSVYTNMAVIFFTKFFEASISGFYFFANRLLKTPFSFFISAFSDVFYQKLSKTTDFKVISKEINHFSLKLLKITFIPFLVVVYSSYCYVTPIFGEKWQSLYIYIEIFAMPIYIGLLLAPYGHVLKIINKQNISLQWHFFKLLVYIFLFLSYFIIDYSLFSFLFLFSFIDALFNILFAMNIDFILKSKMTKSLISISMIFIGLIIVNFSLIKGIV